MRARWFMGLAIGVVVVAGRGVPAAAEERTACPICSRANDDTSSYPSKAGHTLVRGASNALLGWTELIRQPASEVKDGGSVLMGIGKGIGQTVTRTLGGVAEALTFWTPKVQHGYLHFSKDCPVCMGRKSPQ